MRFGTPSRVSVTTRYIEPSSHWGNLHPESVGRNRREELLDLGVSDALLGAKAPVARWQRNCDGVRPHTALGYRPPAPEAAQPWYQGWARYDRKITAAQGVGLT